MSAADFRSATPVGRETQPLRERSLSAPDAVLHRHLLAVPILLTLHNVEEVAGGLAGVRDVAMQRAPALVRALAGPAEAWYLAVAVVTAIPWALLLLPGLARRDSPAARALVVLQAALALNVLTHAGASVLLGGYAPGVATALLLNAPFSVLFFRRAWREEWVSRRLLRWTPVFAVLLHGPALLGLLAICSAIAR